MQSGRLATDEERLCRALVDAIDERGWIGTSPGLVARRAGLSISDFYDCFRSLEQCYVAVYDRMLARVSRLAERALADDAHAPGPAAWREQLEAVLGSVLWFFSLEPALARVCVVEVLNAGPAARARRDSALEQFTDFVEGLRLANGEPMPPLAAEVIVLGTTKLIHARVARDEADTLAELLPELRQLWTTTVDEQTDDSALALS